MLSVCAKHGRGNGEQNALGSELQFRQAVMNKKAMDSAVSIFKRMDENETKAL
jgi:hypothetical protein